MNFLFAPALLNLTALVAVITYDCWYGRLKDTHDLDR